MLKNKLLAAVILLLIIGVAVLIFSTSDKKSTTTPDDVAVINNNSSVLIKNQGGNMEGHTPRGFRGSGTGLFVGDNLNPSFPDGDGVQMFLTFDLGSISNNDFRSAVLSSKSAHINGTPLEDLGVLRVEVVEYNQFSSALWELEPISSACVFDTSQINSFACNVTSAIKQSLEDGRNMAQFRIRFDKAGDNDGNADLVLFYNTDSNTNEPGIFELTLNNQEIFDEVQDYFDEKLREGILERIGQPIEGFVPFMFMQAFSGIVPQDFDGAKALLGEYKIVEKELIFVMDKSGPIHSAAEALSDEGMKTVFKNIQKRAGVSIVSIDEVDGLMLFLGAPQKISLVECLPEQRNVEACIEIYQPVCATINVQCVTTPCDPVQNTFSNSCTACSNSLVETYTEGACSEL